MFDDAKVVHERLKRAYASSSNVVEATELARKKNEISELAARIQSLANRRAMLRQRNVPLSLASDVVKIKKHCVMIFDRFVESPTASTLTDSNRWVKLEKALTEFIALENAVQNQDWSSYYVSRLFGGVSPELRQQTILTTLPQNFEALKNYRRLYTQLKQHRNSVPATALDLEAVLNCSRELSEIRFVENEDVPISVREFFNATSTGSGASLDLLTPEVVVWLRTNDMLNNYAIRART